MIAMLILAGAMLGAGYWFLTPPTFEASALVKVPAYENQLLQPVVRPVRAEDVDGKSVESQIALLRSRSAVGRAVVESALEIETQLVRFPLFGDALFRHLGPADAIVDFVHELSASIGITGYSWADDSIQVATFEVPAPLLGETLELVVAGNGRFELFDPDGQKLGQGEVGRTNIFPHPDGGSVRLAISSLAAAEGTRFTVVRRSLLSAIGNFNRLLSVAETGKQSGVIEVSLKGRDPQLLAIVVNHLVEAYVAATAELQTTDAAQKLRFLETQLPILKASLEVSEEALSRFRAQAVAVDLDDESEVLLDRTAQTEGQLLELGQQRDQLEHLFTARHPRMMALNEQIARVQRELQTLHARAESLPDKQRELLRRQREVDVNTQLYTALLHSAQEQGLAKAGGVGSAHIIDYAVAPELADWPKGNIVLVLGTVLGLFAGLAYAFARESLVSMVAAPDEVEGQLGLPVLAVVPHSRIQDRISRRRSGGGSSGNVLALSTPGDGSVESIRSLHAVLERLMANAERRIVMICSPTKSNGKSFLAVNLATVLAQIGKKVLLIDGDLRAGQLHRVLGAEREPGLAELLAGQASIEGVVRYDGMTGVHCIASGLAPPRPYELLSSRRFEQTVETLVGRFDYILIDAPPALGVADAGLLGRVSAATIMVARAGAHSMSELAHSARRLQRAGVTIAGVVVNDSSQASSYHDYPYAGTPI
jgi:tyrosine-protein kinase Etk/Wzc